MRYLKPKGTLIKINDKNYRLLFSLDAIDEIQDRTQLPLQQVVHMTTEKRYRKNAIEVLLLYLTGEKIEVNENELDYYSTVLIHTYIDQIKSKPYDGEKKGEHSDDYEFVDVERLFYIVTSVLGYSEEEAWKMTLGKIYTLLKDHRLYNGLIKEDKEVDIMDVEG